jgi:hypothetical protein
LPTETSDGSFPALWRLQGTLTQRQTYQALLMTNVSITDEPVLSVVFRVAMQQTAAAALFRIRAANEMTAALPEGIYVLS